METNTTVGRIEKPLSPLVPQPSTLVELARRVHARSRALRGSAYGLAFVIAREVQS